MKYLSEKMQSILERLSEMFPGSSYQSSLDAYLADKGITDAAQLENTIYDICLSIGQTRAACALARVGRYEEAKALMTK
jgi:hypothetical protein